MAAVQASCSAAPTTNPDTRYKVFARLFVVREILASSDMPASLSILGARPLRACISTGRHANVRLVPCGRPSQQGFRARSIMSSVEAEEPETPQPQQQGAFEVAGERLETLLNAVRCATAACRLVSLRMLARTRCATLAPAFSAAALRPAAHRDPRQVQSAAFGSINSRHDCTAQEQPRQPDG